MAKEVAFSPVGGSEFVFQLLCPPLSLARKGWEWVLIPGLQVCVFRLPVSPQPVPMLISVGVFGPSSK